MLVLGLPGDPSATLGELERALKGAHWPSLALVLLTPRPGERRRYAALVLGARETLLSHPAFGPGYGEEGARALFELVRLFIERGARGVYEAGLSPGLVAALLSGEARLVSRVKSAKNPLDYRRLLLKLSTTS